MRFPGSLRLVSFLALAGLAIACSDLLVDPAPLGIRSLALSLIPSQQGTPGSQVNAFERADFARVIVRQGGETIADTTVAFASAGQETRLRMELAARFASEPVDVEVELRAGSVVVFRGVSTVTLQEAGATPIEIGLQPIAGRVDVLASPSLLTALGATVQLQAAAAFGTGDSISAPPIVWRSLSPQIVEISPSGLATARSEGEGRVEAAMGAAADTGVVIVSAIVTRLVMDPASLTLLVGDAAPLTGHAEDANGNRVPRGVLWSSSDSSVATFGAGGTVRGVAAGAAVITGVVGTVTGTANVSVLNPSPVLQSINPIGGLAGGGATTVSLRGSGYVSTSQAFWNGAARPVVFVSSTELRMSLTTEDVAIPGNFSVYVESPAPGGGRSQTITFALISPVPVIEALSPPQETAGRETPLTLTVSGRGFVPSSVVRWNGSAQPTEYVNEGALRAQIPSSDLTAPGGAQVSVLNPGPGGGASNDVFFTILSATPSVTALVPDSILVGSGFLTLAVRGQGFSSSSIVRLDGSARPTEFYSPTELRVALPSSDFEVPRVVQVTVFSPAPGGGTSSPVPFTVFNPSPAITRLTPDSVGAGSAGFTLRVTGSGFVSSSVVRWNGSSRPTSFDAATGELTAAIAAADVATAGVVPVTVVTPGPGGGTSPAVNFTVYNAAPAITVLNPDTVLVGSGSFTLSVSGTGFVATSVVRWGGSNRPTTYDTTTRELRASIPASDVAATAIVPITVVSPAPGGGVSAPANFVVANPVAAITSVTPDSLFAGTQDTTLVVLGSGFLPSSVARWNGAARPTVVVSASQLRVTILDTDLEEPTTGALTVLNPAPGGGSSAPFNVAVLSHPSIQLSTDSVGFVATTGQAVVPTQVVAVSNGGDGTLSDLGISVVLDGVEDPEWLDASLNTTTAPATVTLQATADSLEAGTYRATLFVSSNAADNSPQQVEVTIFVANGISFWQADGNYLDSGSAGNHGTPIGAVGFGGGFIGSSFQFGPGAAEIRTPEAGGLNSATAVTLATWVNLDVAEPGIGVRRFITMRPERAVLRLDGQFGPGVDNSLHFYSFTSTGAVGMYAPGILTGRNCWFHVAATYDGVTARLYYQGNQVATAGHVGTINRGNGEGIMLSNADGGGVESLSGRLDEVRVFGRAASAFEIADWANDGPAGAVCGAGAP